MYRRKIQRGLVPVAVTLLLLTWLGACAVTEPDPPIFPYKVEQRQLENGLKVVVIPFDSPGIVAYFTVVRTGSRDEVEPGHSGFAHFFEHMMFRGTPRFSQQAYNDVLKRMGADSNASTSDDLTRYYIIGPARELETMMDIESDRFKNLSYTEDDFRTEALAVLGEYNKNVSNPGLPLLERVRDLAFDAHTYEHTTIGFLEDIQAMPEYYDYSLGFFDRFYRPENCIVLVVGDAEPEAVFELAGKYYGDWEAGYQSPAIATEPAPQEGKRDHLSWPNPTPPYLMMGYRAPAFSDGTPDSAALDLISQLLFSESAPLYQKLVVEEQWVDFIGGGLSDHRDPYLFLIQTRIKSEELVPKVEEAVAQHIAELQESLVDEERLSRIKSHLRYDFAQGLDTAGSIAFQVAHYLSLTGEVETVNRIYRQYNATTPEDIQRLARDVFRPEGQIVVTLSHDPAPHQQSSLAPASPAKGGRQ